MRFDNNELVNLFNFIIENKSFILDDKKLISRETLPIIRMIIERANTNNFQLTSEQEQLLINSLLNNIDSFNEESRRFIIVNGISIKNYLDKDLEKIGFIKIYVSELENYIVNKSLNEKIVIKNSTPRILKKNYIVALNSIRLDALSANYVDWDSMNDEQRNILIDETINNSYVLSGNSCLFLNSNPRIVLDSIKKDINNIEFANPTVKYEPEVFRYLLLNGYYFESSILKNIRLGKLEDIDVFSCCLKRFGVYGLHPKQYNKKYIDRFNKIFYNAINSRPTVKAFESLFGTLAENSWKEYRKENIDNYENIFGKICTELRNANDFDVALTRLHFLSLIEEELGTKYDQIYNAMEKYFIIYHSDTVNKLEKLRPYQDTIAKLSALYVSKKKEEFKKSELDMYYDEIKSYFVPKLGNPLVNKRIVQRKKKEIFQDLYLANDKKICDFVDSLIQKYSKQEDKKLVIELINGFIFSQYSKIEEIMPAPPFYNEYERYEKTIKLVNRLNRGYIQYDGIEVLNYKDIIKYDNFKGKYVYIGLSFDEDVIEKYEKFKEQKRLCENIKKDITLEIKNMKIDVEIDTQLLYCLIYELPFTDEYVEFDIENLNNFNFGDLFSGCINYGFGYEPDSFIDDDAFSLLCKLLIDNGIIWLLLFKRRNSRILEGFDKSEITNLINNMKKMADFSKQCSFDTNRFDELILLENLCNYADDKSIAILGKDMIEILCTELEYTDCERESIISIAEELVAQMAKRSKSTVPYVRGETINYKYSIYDSQDNTLLLAGINTDACFRVDGNDNDFLHYCALDKNGFVIKITDSYNNFIARASGFRNGNCVFLNQLRTVYDEGGNYYHGYFENEKNDIIEALKNACNDIVNTSQSNENENDKIDFVFITQSYSLNDIESNVSDDVTDEIGDAPMDNESSDWKEFVKNTQNLKDVKHYGYFDTDYGNYSLICMASSKDIATIKCYDIMFKDVEAVYERTRNTITVTNNPDIDILNSINKINGINSYFSKTPLEPVIIAEDSVVLTGDNWYIIYSNGCIINSCVLDFDKKAMIEFDTTKKLLEEYTLNNGQSINTEQIEQFFESQSSEKNSKVFN